MSTAIDTNVLVALWDRDNALNLRARTALDSAQRRGQLVISAPVFTELLASRQRSEAFVDAFCNETGILIDWVLEEAVWRAAGRGFQAYSLRPKRPSGIGPRRILADFLIGAHALKRNCALLTFDDGLYRAAFPRLMVVSA